ncbi:MAG TPA: hypothetical protein VF267_12735 [Gammaproteobacteria bacterium]
MPNGQSRVKKTAQGRRFVIRARFTGATPEHITQLAREKSVYLGKRGQWSSLGKALRFASRQAAELALNDKWYKLRNSGSRGVILSVIGLPDD